MIQFFSTMWPNAFYNCFKIWYSTTRIDDRNFDKENWNSLPIIFFFSISCDDNFWQLQIYDCKISLFDYHMSMWRINEIIQNILHWHKKPEEIFSTKIHISFRFWCIFPIGMKIQLFSLGMILVWYIQWGLILITFRWLK